jgi:hypothetical protein
MVFDFKKAELVSSVCRYQIAASNAHLAGLGIRQNELDRHMGTHVPAVTIGQALKALNSPVGGHQTDGIWRGVSQYQFSRVIT